jgi:hypothetical protein
VVFSGNAWSFRLLISLLSRGYQVICGVVMGAFEDVAHELFPVLRDEGLFEGVFWLTLDVDNMAQLRHDVAAITPQLHCVIPVYTWQCGLKAVSGNFRDTPTLKSGILDGAFTTILMLSHILTTVL